MPWVALNFKDKRMQPLAKKFEVKGVPRLVILKKNGEIVDNNAVQKAMTEGPNAVEEWLAKV